ncbi:biotin/lipoyl-binding protein [Billgrantia azerbaijanica]|nr:biotin/lipoyl-binding protein [Halomonas azerbaijanica]
MIKRLLPVLILALGVAGFLALRLTRPEPAPAVPEERSWRVETLTVELVERAPVLPLFGEIVAPDRLEVVAPLPGRIAARPVHDGQRVSAGTLLVALDEADSRPPLRQAEAEVADLEAQIDSERIRHANDREALEREREILATAQRSLERIRSLVARNLASQTELDNARDTLARARLEVTTRERSLAEHPARLKSLEARLARAEAVRDAAQRDLQRSRVTAPFDGIVTGVEVAPGDQVGANAPLLSLYPVGGLELRARVPRRYQEELADQLARGTRIIAVAEEGGQRFVVERLAGESAPTGTEAILALQGPADGLRPGSLVPVRLERPAIAEALAVPFSALHGSDVLYRVSDASRLERLNVTRRGEVPGPDGARWALVTSDELKAGDRIVVTHLPNAMSGLRVDVAGAVAGGNGEPEA